MPEMLYFHNLNNGDFNVGNPDNPPCVCYPLRELKAVSVKNGTELQFIFESPQAAGTDAENNTSGIDVITLHITTAYNHKRAFKDIVQTIEKHLAQNNGFIVMADAAQYLDVLGKTQYPGSDFRDDPDTAGSIVRFEIVIDEPE